PTEADRFEVMDFAEKMTCGSDPQERMGMMLDLMPMGFLIHTGDYFWEPGSRPPAASAARRKSWVNVSWTF
ncbi:hypothetical protein, partial [Rhizobium ruizarguesonis]|uniref:hypothetical protein n=1 Tax=Rhizobium ruizarguesonis TaxID=2081791 RepID=UPI001953BD1A